MSELSGKGTVIAHAGGDLDDATASRVVERVKELEHRGFQFEAADGSFDLLIRRETGEYEPLFRLESWRVMASKSEDGRVETEATIKLWVDGKRYVRTAEGNGPVHALDRALREAIGERFPHLRDIKLVNYKVRILDEWKATGATTRVLLDASDGDAHLGRDRRPRERHRGQLGRAGGLAGGGDAAFPRGDDVTIPLARPVLGEAEERAVIDVLRTGQLSLGPKGPEFEAAFAQRVGARHASAVSSGTAALHLALRAVGVTDGDEVITSPFSFVASANAIVYERARPVFADIDPRTLNLDPDAAAAAITGRTKALLPVHIFGYPADLAGAGAPRAADRRGRLRGARRALRRRHAGRRPRPSGDVRVLRQQAAHHRRGRDAHAGLGRAQGARGLRAQPGPRAGHGLARPRPAGLQLPAHRHRLRARPGPARAPRRHAGRPRARRRLVPRGAGRLRGLELPCEDAGGEVRGWFVFVVQLPHGVGRDDTIRALAARGVQSKPYLPAIHLMSYYREAFGHREGEFPVCEDVAARSIALPFFPALTEGEVAQVAEALEAVIYATLK